MLTLGEELLMLSLPDASGRRRGNLSSMNYMLVGAGLLELILADRIRMDEKKRLSVINATTMGNELLDGMLAQLAAAQKPATIQTWVGKLVSRLPRYQRQHWERLVEAGIVREIRHRFLGLIPYREYQLLDHRQTTASREGLRKVLLHGTDPEPRMAGLVALLSAAGVLEVQFEKPERKVVRARAKQFLKDNAVANAVAEQIASAAAAMIAITAAATAAASSSD